MMEIAVYQFKATLKAIEPAIWRRVELPGSVSLSRLHKVLQAAFGWSGRYEHRFIVDGTEFRIPDHGDRQRLIRDERDCRIRELFPEVGAECVYTYVVGAGWDVILEVEKIYTIDPTVPHQRCLGGERNSPPEDTGGKYGYLNYIMAIKDPSDPEYKHWMELIGDDFDSEHFDLDALNTAVLRVR